MKEIVGRRGAPPRRPNRGRSEFKGVWELCSSLLVAGKKKKEDATQKGATATQWIKKENNDRDPG